MLESFLQWYVANTPLIAAGWAIVFLAIAARKAHLHHLREWHADQLCERCGKRKWRTQWMRGDQVLCRLCQPCHERNPPRVVLVAEPDDDASEPEAEDE